VEVSLGAIESKAEALFARQRIERLTLLASQLMAMSWLPRALAASEAANPTIRIDLMIEGSQPKAASNSLERRMLWPAPEPRRYRSSFLSMPLKPRKPLDPQTCAGLVTMGRPIIEEGRLGLADRTE
jgi:DNA-binding transcriptional LysR family regulator